LRTLAEMAAATGRTEEARRWYEDLLAVDPMNSEIRAAMGRLAATGADAATADQPAGSGDGWGGAHEQAAAAGAGALADAADGNADAEWGNLDLDAPAPAVHGEADSETPEFDAFGFGEVALDEEAAPPSHDLAPRADEQGAAHDDLPLLDFGPEAEAEDDAAPLPSDSAGADEEEPEVVTETLAELYASQGLTARAAGVYRELIQRRGDEPGLLRRLAELEGEPDEAADGPAETPDWLLRIDDAGDEDQRDPLPELELDASFPALELEEESVPPAARHTDDADDSSAEDDGFADSVSTGLSGVGAEAEFEVQSAGASDESERATWEPPAVAEEDAGEFAPGFDLVVIDESRSPDDEPVPLDGDAFPPASAEDAAELSADWAVAAAPLEEQEAALEQEAGVEPEPVRPGGGTMRGYFDALLAWSPSGADAAPAPSIAALPEREPEAQETGGPPAEPHAEAAPSATDEHAHHAAPAEAAAAEEMAGEEPLPWELPSVGDSAPAETGAAAEAEPAGSASGAGFSFEEFFTPEPEPEAEPERAPELPAEPARAVEPPSASPGGTEAAGAPPAGGEDDEDLESFQAWLQSLKR
jgi:hypothetical protein